MSTQILLEDSISDAVTSGGVGRVSHLRAVRGRGGTWAVLGRGCHNEPHFAQKICFGS